MALECIAKGVPGLGANLFGREHPSQRFHLVAHCGRCVNSGRQHLPKTNDDPAFDGSLEHVHGKDGSVATRFYADGEPLALLYLEPPPQGMSEEDLDFLACIIKLLEWQLPIRTERLAERLDAASTLVLKDSRSIIGEHDSMKTLFGHIQRAARSDATVLIFGETGTGKELVAQALHDYSRRSHGPMTPVNCGALPKELIESELFGHRQGSFTGAVRDKPGLFDAASGGTLFLDEIGALSLDLQVRLLRVLQERKVRRVGETRERAVDVRIVAATNQPLEDLIAKGLFREDLYHRLNVYYLEIPPLRERPTDVPHLAQFFLDSFNRRWGTRKTISARARLHLSRYDYPGNVRELENILESAYHLCDETIDLPQVSSRLARPKKESSRTEMLAGLVERMVDGQAGFWDDVRGRLPSPRSHPGRPSPDRLPWLGGLRWKLPAPGALLRTAQGGLQEVPLLPVQPRLQGRLPAISSSTAETSWEMKHGLSKAEALLCRCSPGICAVEMIVARKCFGSLAGGLATR